MTNIAEIKAAIQNLTLSERAEIARFVHGWSDDAWDDQIKKDFDSGKLKTLLQQVEDDIANDALEEGP
jgi:hypothetical protein